MFHQTITKTAPPKNTKRAAKHANNAKQPKKCINKTAALATYSFHGRSDISISSTNHQISMKCKVFGMPRPQYRCFVKANNSASTRKINVYNTSNHERDSFKNAITAALASAGCTNPFEWFGKGSTVPASPMELKVWFYFPRPKTHYSYHTAFKKLILKSNAPVYVTKAPDIDNCLKLVMDAMQGVLYHEDKCVCSVEANKL